ncbi:MAG: GTP-binding protein [Hyphomicrobiaceae bacterium]|nr:GTP-binding protein [Hyphomicrobiaceae bacterium]
MPTPILLITGYLGAGKTTLINRILRDPQGRKLAAVVNDFGTINIDAALLASVSDDVISLKNGCICCSLLGDLLQTLSMILRRDPAPDGIVIETSGLSNPAEIVRTLLDPVIWKEAALETVICVADARSLIDEPRLAGDGLWQSQLVAADIVALSKTDLVSDKECERVKAMVRRQKADHLIYDMVDGYLSPELLFATDVYRWQPDVGVARANPPHSFETISWTSVEPLDMVAFQAVISRYAGVLVRAKGLVTFAGRPKELLLFQLVGTRATIGRGPAGASRGFAAELVFIAKRGTMDTAGLTSSLAQCCAADTG